MQNVVFNEQRETEEIMKNGNVSQDNVVKIISGIAKYNFYVMKLDDDESYKNISDWLRRNYGLYVETEFDEIIRDKINAAHKFGFLYSEDLLIYQKELDVITAAQDIRVEKVLFALLCIAKLQRNLFGCQNGKYKFALTNIFKLARVHIPSVDREMFMHQLCKDGLIGAPYKNSDDNRWVNFICEEGTPVLTITENDFDELAYVYLNWKNGGGYTRCKQCGKLIKDSKKHNKQYCKDCGEENIRVNKSLWAKENYNSRKSSDTTK